VTNSYVYHLMCSTKPTFLLLVVVLADSLFYYIIYHLVYPPVGIIYAITVPLSGLRS
jgi:hypothetical protein